jgi:phosphoenolpyruvate synthase/pyruvate phosphate dikinase
VGRARRRSDQRASPEESLRADQVLEIADAARRAAAHFGFLLDIEWAFEDERRWFLQARPITALPSAVNPVLCRPRCRKGSGKRESHSRSRSPQ